MLIDKEDIDVISDICVHSRVDPKNNNVYASATVDRKMKQIHRMILEKHTGRIPEGFVVDHLVAEYFGGLDNRKANLRIVNVSMNNRNIRIHKNNGSNYVGVNPSKYGW